MRNKSATPDLVIAGMAARQHGVVSIRQILAAGLTRTGVARRVETGRLHPVHRGVYAVGHVPVNREGRWMAAILACGSDTSAPLASTVLDRWGAALSHRSAAELWQLLPPGDGPVDVSVPSDGGRHRRTGIRLHRCSTLLPAAVTSRHGIPATTPARTIADLRRVTSPKELRRAIRQAEVLGLPTGAEAVTERTRSDLELAFRRLCRRHGLPAPEVNVHIDSMEVDFLWRDRRLVVETDGYRYHCGKEAFMNDRDRDLRLRALGFDVVRLSEQQVADEPQRVAAVLRPMLQ